MKSHMVFGVTAVFLGVFLVPVQVAFAQGDPVAGKTVFTQKCSTCHVMTAEPGHGPTGPNLMGVVGRTAGTIAGWDFSPPLRDSKLVWTDENLNKWLTDPEALVPGNLMLMKVPNKFEREDVLAYIKSVDAEAKNTQK